jgi:hypothetical protein
MRVSPVFYYLFSLLRFSECIVLLIHGGRPTSQGVCESLSFYLQKLHNILIAFGIAMQLVSLIKMCSNETYNKVHIGESV